MSGNITSRSISASAEVSLCPHLPTSHFFLCLLLANGLPPCRGKRGSCQGVSAFIILYPSLTQAAKASEILQDLYVSSGSKSKNSGSAFSVSRLTNKVRYFFERSSSNSCEKQRNKEGKVFPETPSG